MTVLPDYVAAYAAGLWHAAIAHGEGNDPRIWNAINSVCIHLEVLSPFVEMKDVR